MVRPAPWDVGAICTSYSAYRDAAETQPLLPIAAFNGLENDWHNLTHIWAGNEIRCAAQAAA